MQVTSIFLHLFSFVSAILILLILVAGSNQNVLSDYFFLKVKLILPNAFEK